jgi:hypothetical protein
MAAPLDKRGGRNYYVAPATTTWPYQAQQRDWSAELIARPAESLGLEVALRYFSHTR